MAKGQYLADKNRYDSGMDYERCGRSGVLLPKVSLGFWHNFGSIDPYERSRNYPEITNHKNHTSRKKPLASQQTASPQINPMLQNETLQLFNEPLTS